MDWDSIASWFKTSIPGIIILGAIGSMAALPLVYLIKWLFEKFLNALDVRLIFPMGKRMRLTEYIIQNHIRSGDSARLIIFVVMRLSEFIINTLFMCTAVGVTIIYFSLVPARLTIGSFILITFTFVCILGFLISVINTAGIETAVFGNTIQKDFDRFRKMGWEEYGQVVREIAPQSSLAKERAEMEKQVKPE